MNMNLIAVLGLFAVFALLVALVLIVRKDVLSLSLIVKQAMSGRWILTVSAGLCMLIATIADALIALKTLNSNPAVQLPFPVSTIFTLSGVVFTFYFMKKEKETDEETTRVALEIPPKNDIVAKEITKEVTDHGNID